jgi:hypothetical protein
MTFRISDVRRCFIFYVRRASFFVSNASLGRFQSLTMFLYYFLLISKWCESTRWASDLTLFYYVFKQMQMHFSTMILYYFLLCFLVGWFSKRNEPLTLHFSGTCISYKFDFVIHSCKLRSHNCDPTIIFYYNNYE